MTEMQGIDYQPFYCEENIWRLAQREQLSTSTTEVVFIVGGRAAMSPASPGPPEPRVACWHQKAAEPGEAVLWDYHVVLAERGPAGTLVWDLDTRLPCPCAADLWLLSTFQDAARVPARYHPSFRVIASEVFVRELASDRSHMRDARGRWRRPPPSWDPPTGSGAQASNLASYTHAGPGGPGLLLTRAALAARWRGTELSGPGRRPGSE